MTSQKNSCVTKCLIPRDAVKERPNEEELQLTNILIIG